MLRFHHAAFLLIATAIALPTIGQEIPTTMFDGQSLDGWEFADDEQKWWTVKEGAISGGSLTEKVPRNTFLSTKESFQNFDLTLRIRIRGAGGFINSGIQIRSIRSGHDMSGYQVDAGDGWWGKMYDEHRRNKVIAQAADLKAVQAVIRESDWNDYRILAEGTRIRSWINGVPALDYQETDPNIPLDGHIGIQVHGGGKALVEVQDVKIRRLPATPGAMTWKQIKAANAKPATQPVDKVAAQMDLKTTPLSPSQEQAGFQVPDGFEVELVAEESTGIGKFVATSFDAAGRMWTMTAMEYPVDGNENAERSRQLFARGGVDKVLVFDQPFGKDVPQPRVFVDGLVMPLGILPYEDGVYVQYGNDIRFYRDTDGDGRADTHEVVLTGFGTQDSHLFPHQFTRAPGGWLLTAQGLFNTSNVTRPNGLPFENGEKSIRFHQCKLARFTLDGSMFESLTAGPNNIWGLTVSREGETWLQEANDIGYPIIPYEPGGLYATGSQDRLKSYQPMMPPPLAPAQMGGTGLSGLALADDRNGWPAPWGLKNADPNSPRMFYLANPITSRIQVIKATPNQGRYRYEKQTDFLISQDPKFRPVSIQFGPDGCLYITDWYNKIISHNEVPRNHPERDKLRGRIWRIRHQSQPRPGRINIRALAENDLINRLGNDNSMIAKFAWQEIVDRGATSLAPQLMEIVGDSKLPDDKRVGALWALEGLQSVPASLLMLLAKDDNANLRHEAVRIAGAQPMPSDEFVAIASPLVEDLSPKVRAATGDALRRVKNVDADVIALMVQLAKPSISGDVWQAYDREFERYLARWAMEMNSQQVARFIASPAGQAMPLENRLLATLSLSGQDAALGLATQIPQLQRSLTKPEIRVLAEHVNETKVAQAVHDLLRNEASREGVLQSLLALRTSIDTKPLMSSIESTAASLLGPKSSNAAKQLAIECIGAFKLRKLDCQLAELAAASAASEAFKLSALRALRELGTTQFGILSEIASSQSQPAAVRYAALAALAESPSQQAANALGSMLSDLDFDHRASVIGRMATSRTGAQALLDALDESEIAPEDLDPAALETMQALLPENEAIKELWADVAGDVRRTLKLGGDDADYVATPITLSGPFTVETWLRLDANIDHSDGILGRPGELDMNFYDSQFRVYIHGTGDIVIANKKSLAETWTHLAVSRDEKGIFRIYINGELSAESSLRDTATYTDLQIGRTTPSSAGTSGSLCEYRVWNVARSGREIRDHFDRRLSGSDAEHGQELVHCFGGSEWGVLSGEAKVEATLELPKLLSAAEAKQQAEMFHRYRELASRPGNASAGKALFEKKCLVCHQQNGKGGMIGPALDGVGLTGTEALLRNILTPSAAMEGGYRNYQVLTYSGRIVQGLLVSQDESSVIIRQPNTTDQQIRKSDIERAGYSGVSVMPDGLLQDLKPQQVQDLFAYIHSLEPTQASK